MGCALVQTLSAIEIEEFASRPGACKEDVEYFLYSVGQFSNEDGALLNLYYDARLYRWEISTIRAIEAGIKSVYEKEEI
jgi:hypothetical protein